jgi:hypothetical protein
MENPDRKQNPRDNTTEKKETNDLLRPMSGTMKRCPTHLKVKDACGSGVLLKNS